MQSLHQGDYILAFFQSPSRRYAQHHLSERDERRLVALAAIWPQRMDETGSTFRVNRTADLFGREAKMFKIPIVAFALSVLLVTAAGAQNRTFSEPNSLPENLQGTTALRPLVGPATTAIDRDVNTSSVNTRQPIEGTAQAGTTVDGSPVPPASPTGLNLNSQY